MNISIIPGLPMRRLSPGGRVCHESHEQEAQSQAEDAGPTALVGATAPSPVQYAVATARPQLLDWYGYFIFPNFKTRSQVHLSLGRNSQGP